VLAADFGQLPWTRKPVLDRLARVSSRITDDMASAARRLHRIRCGLGGHEMMLHFEPARIALECANCGEQTQGWRIQAPRAS
jgi:ribosomal protein L44E